jgi:putative holliday junction resolvase
LRLRIMALDLGDKRIGIAVSDPMLFGANPLETYTRVEVEKDCAYIAKLAREYPVDIMLLGWPRNMNGTEGPRCQATAEFAVVLEKHITCPIDIFDERLTTAAAERILIEADMSREKRKKVIDKMAAVVFLQGYLDAKAYLKRRELPWKTNG